MSRASSTKHSENYASDEFPVGTLSDLAEVIMGQSPSGDSYNTSGAGTPLINGPSEFDGSAIARVRWTTAPTKTCMANDLIVCVRGNTVGRVAKADDAYCLGRGVAAIRAREGRADQGFVDQVVRANINNILRLTNGSTFPNIDGASLKSLPAPTISLGAQRGVALVLSTWDEALERLARQIEQKKRLLESIRERLIHGAHRLGGRNSPWPMIGLSEVTKQLTERNGARYGRDLVMGVTKAEGIVPMREHVVAEDISRYLVLPPCGFAYNPMRINIGSIAMSEHEGDVIVSPDYVVFACKEDRLHPRFLNHLRRTKAWADFMTIAGNGSVRVRIYYASLAEFEFHLPPLDEQRAIVEVLDDAEREIAALKAERAALAKQRDALATELLTGRLRVPQAEAAS